jgi:hypothetical protein
MARRWCKLDILCCMSTEQNVRLVRREFLKLMLLGVAAAGCSSRPSDPTAAPTLLATPAGTLPPTVALAVQFVLENEAVGYTANPVGCDRTTIQGTVHDASGTGVSGMILRIWADDPAAASTLQTGIQGEYALDVAQELTDQEYHLQLVDASNTVLLSDVIVSQAVPSCDLNLMTVNFVAK